MLLISHILVFQLNGDNIAPVLIKKSLHLFKNPAVPLPDLCKISFIIFS